MKFTISYKFKLKMAQNLSGRSGPVGAGGAGPVPVGAGQGRPVPIGAGAVDRPKETLYKNRVNFSSYIIIIFYGL